jgi:hypothetical protein
VIYCGTAVCSVTQCVHGARQKMKMGMPVHNMRQIAHSLEKFCDKYNIIKYVGHKGYPFQPSVGCRIKFNYVEFNYVECKCETVFFKIYSHLGPCTVLVTFVVADCRIKYNYVECKCVCIFQNLQPFGTWYSTCDICCGCIHNWAKTDDIKHNSAHS